MSSFIFTRVSIITHNFHKPPIKTTCQLRGCHNNSDTFFVPRVFSKLSMAYKHEQGANWSVINPVLSYFVTSRPFEWKWYEAERITVNHCSTTSGGTYSVDANCNQLCTVGPGEELHTHQKQRGRIYIKIWVTCNIERPIYPGKVSTNRPVDYPERFGMFMQWSDSAYL